ncbi:MAG TPA: AIR synthase-related protein, partial [Chitinophagaceae bacterium]|nr:AIR synthase-related protein [Chitinophagaceae bacterium]
GNVSFYNQSPDGPIFPSPVIGMVGLLDNLSQRLTLDFKQEGDLIYLLGKSRDDLASSTYLSKILKIEDSPAPHFDLEEEFALQATIKNLNKKDILQSAHDVSDGGLFTTLLESAIPNNLGFQIKTNKNIRKDAYLFGESQSRVIVSIDSQNREQFETLIAETTFELLGKVTSKDLQIDNEIWGESSEWAEDYNTALEKAMEG